MKRLTVYLTVVFVILGISVSVNAAAKAPEKQTPARIVQKAPDFTLKDLNGNDVTLSSFKDKKVLLVFGATWCPSCVAEVPDLNAFFDKHQDKDVKIIDIDLRESAAKVASFVKKHNIRYTVLLDVDGKVASQYNVYGIPTIFLIDENGIIKYSGSKPQGGFEALLK